MHPILIRFGTMPVPTYGFFVAAGFLLALALAIRRGQIEGVKQEIITELAFCIIIGALLGARLYYALEHLPYFKIRPWEILYVWKGGLTFYGGFIGAFISSLFYVKGRSLPLWDMADLLAPSIPVGHAVGRLGCFFAGCCYGKPSNLPWAVTFTDPQSLARLGTPIHPTQLYHALANFSIFLIVSWEYPKRKFSGQVFLIYTLLYGIGRFAIEFFRGDPRTFLGSLSLSQWLSLVEIAGSFALLILLKMRGTYK